MRELHESLLTLQLGMLNLGRSDVTGTGTAQPQPSYYSATVHGAAAAPQSQSQSKAASAAGIHATFICGGFSG